MKATARVIIPTALALLLSVTALFFIGRRLRYPHYYEYAGETGLNASLMRRHYGRPHKSSERLLGICLAADRGDWDKVLEMTSPDRSNTLETYFHNLACAMKGCLADSLMHYYQPFSRGLFLTVDEMTSPFVIAQSGEVWYRLGAMTMAEHSAMLALAFSPAKTGPKFLRRLADINFINGDSEAVLKYERILGYRPEWTPDKLQIRSFIARTDTVHLAKDFRSLLKLLIRSNPDNAAARDYLLCLDLLEKDIDAFVKDYGADGPSSRLYEEAALIYLCGSGTTSSDLLSRFHVGEETLREFIDFTHIFESAEGDRRIPLEKYRHTYWYYYKFATLVTNDGKH